MACNFVIFRDSLIVLVSSGRY